MASNFLYLIIWIINGSLVFVYFANGVKHELNLGFKFVEEPRDIIVKKGSSVTWSCAVQGNRASSSNKYEHSWTKDGQKLDKHSKQFEVLGNGSLKIQRVRQSEQHNHEGEYQCLVERKGVGILTSEAVQLRVAYLNRFTREPENVTAYKGGVVRFWCKIEGFPFPSIRWMKNGKLLPQEDRYIQLASGSLEIYDLESSDAGNYRCLVSNLARNRTSKRAYLNVTKPGTTQKMVILATPKNVTSKTRRNAVLECAASGKPSPNITWHRLGGLTQRSRRYGKGNLEIINVEESDAGWYTCVISNATKSYRKSAVLTVIETPSLKFLYAQEPPRSRDFNSGEYPTAIVISLFCAFGGYPEPHVYWTKNGQEMTENPRVEISKISKAEVKQKLLLPESYINTHASSVLHFNSLKITNSAEEDTGIYQCFARNSVGQAMGAIHIVVKHSEFAPKHPENVTAVMISDTKIKLMWIQPPSFDKIVAFSAHYIPVNGTTAELQKVVNGKKNDMTIEALRPYTQYKIFIVAWNVYGASVHSKSVKETTDESTPVRAPEVTVSSNSPTSLLLQWEPLVRALARGKVTNYYVHLRKHLTTEEKIREISGDKTEYIWTDLEPGGKYDVYILPATIRGLALLKSESILWVTGQTMELAGGVLEVKALNISTASIDWDNDKLDYKAAAVKEYTLTCDAVDINDEAGITHYPADTVNTTLHGLEPDTLYLFTLNVIFEDGHNSTYEYKKWMPSRDAEDPGPPTHVIAMAESSTQISVKWKYVSWQGCNVHYVVSYFPVNVDQTPFKIHQAVTPTQIKDLKPFTEYWVRVLAKCEDKEKGSRAYLVRTEESLPAKPEQLNVEPDMNSLCVTWNQPKECNGIIQKYHVLYTENNQLPDIEWKKKVENGSSHMTTIVELKSLQNYYVKMCAVTSKGPGGFTEVKNVRTGPVESPQEGGVLGIILGVTIGGSCIVVCLCVLLILFCRSCKCCKTRSRSGRLSSHAARYHSNGCGPSALYLHTSHDMGSHQPMLYENHIDAKGGKSPPASRGTSNGFVMRTNYLPNGNIRTILADNNKQQETSFGPDSSQLPLTSICESLETADTGYSEPREFDPDTLDTSEDEHNTSVLLPADQQGSQATLQSGSLLNDNGELSPLVNNRQFYSNSNSTSGGGSMTDGQDDIPPSPSPPLPSSVNPTSPFQVGDQKHLLQSGSSSNDDDGLVVDSTTAEAAAKNQNTSAVKACKQPTSGCTLPPCPPQSLDYHDDDVEINNSSSTSPITIPTQRPTSLDRHDDQQYLHHNNQSADQLPSTTPLSTTESLKIKSSPPNIATRLQQQYYGNSTTANAAAATNTQGNHHSYIGNDRNGLGLHGDGGLYNGQIPSSCSESIGKTMVVNGAPPSMGQSNASVRA